MNMNLEQVRIAITLFDDPERLWGTVLALISNGLNSKQLCLMARESTMTGACKAFLQNHQKDDRHHMTLLCERVEDLPGDRGERIVATAGPLLVSLLEIDASSGQNGFGAYIFSRHTTGFEHEIEQGLVALLAKSSDSKQQSIVTRTLLNSSLHRVTTCEFAAKSVAPPQSQPA